MLPPDRPMLLEWGGVQNLHLLSSLGMLTGTAGHMPAWKNFPGCPGPPLAQPILQGGHTWASYPPVCAWGVSWGLGRGWREEGRSKSLPLLDWLKSDSLQWN